MNHSLSTFLLITLCIWSTVTSRGIMDETINEIDSRGPMFDPACRGEFNPALYSKLNNVCNDCYYIYNNEQVADNCKIGCFKHVAFKECTKSLKLSVIMYESYAHRLQSKY